MTRVQAIENGTETRHEVENGPRNSGPSGRSIQLRETDASPTSPRRGQTLRRLLDEQGHRPRLRCVHRVAAVDLHRRRPGTLGHRALCVRGDHLVVRRHETFAIAENWLSGRGPAAANSPPGLPQTLRGQEKELIEAALARSRGKVAGVDGAAADLGVPASTLESKIKQLKIDKARFTGGSR